MIRYADFGELFLQGTNLIVSIFGLEVGFFCHKEKMANAPCACCSLQPTYYNMDPQRDH